MVNLQKIEKDYCNNIILTVKKKDDINLLSKFKKHSQLKDVQFFFQNSKYFSNFQIFKSPLPHVNEV